MYEMYEALSGCHAIARCDADARLVNVAYGPRQRNKARRNS